MAERSTHPESYAEIVEFKKNPPELILVFDNWRGNSPEAVERSLLTMQLRAILASSIYHSNMYKGQDKPLVASFAGPHDKQMNTPGSTRIKNLLSRYKVPDIDILTRETTLTTTGDISQLHSLAKEMHLKGTIAIVTTDDHVRRTNQEIKNHFSAHKNEKVPRIFVVSPHSLLADFIKITYANGKLMDNDDINLDPSKIDELDHGIGEKLAYQISRNRLTRRLTPYLEYATHPGLFKIETSKKTAGKMKKAARRLKKLKLTATSNGQDSRKIQGIYRKY